MTKEYMKKSLKQITVKSVKKISLKETIPVYDVSVPGNHNFVLANGCIVHNTANSARDSNFQETLALRGKILNVLRAKKGERVFENEEVMNILKSIGFIPDIPDPMSKLRVGKIILTADADTDGRHINALILACLFRFVPGVFQRNMVYIAKGAEYLAQTPQGNYYGSTLDEVKNQIPPKYHGYILHIKGWGEANADAFSDMVFNPLTRTLLKIKPFNKDGETRFKALMSEDTAYRSHLLGLD